MIFKAMVNLDVCILSTFGCPDVMFLSLDLQSIISLSYFQVATMGSCCCCTSSRITDDFGQVPSFTEDDVMNSIALATMSRKASGTNAPPYVLSSA